MITTITTCDTCKQLIEHPDPLKVIRIHFGHYDSIGTQLQFCNACFNTYRIKLHPEPKPVPFPRIEARLASLLVELIQTVIQDNRHENQ